MMDHSSSNLKSFDNPRPYDVLCGRNRNSFNNIGNRRFRITISMNVEKYNAMRSRHERSKFIASLAQTMRYEVGFRFLKRKEGGAKNAQTVELTNYEIRAKIGHALRDLSSNTKEDGSGRTTTPESKVLRPGPYQKQDKKALRMVSSSASLVTLSSASTMSSAQSTLDGSKPTTASMSTPCPAPVTASSAQIRVSSAPSSVATIEEQPVTLNAQKAGAGALDQICSPSPPVHLMLSKLPQAEQETTPLQSNLLLDNNFMTVSPDTDQERGKLPYHPLLDHIGEGYTTQHSLLDACQQSLLNPPPMYLIPSLVDEEDELDDFWTTSDELLQNEHSALAPATSPMSVGSYCCDTSISRPSSSAWLSDTTMENISLVNDD
ncbi:unnamed protein product [Cylindrotheca closterium]|uniref:DUF6824 domain-containing protein n=1 Tax=Cylindrotheca closterium TaxID=2856 RepID=A0AAD2JHF4_9STRA|nr:unnamed protein product [Cylindrotheca closterium]